VVYVAEEREDTYGVLEGSKVMISFFITGSWVRAPRLGGLILFLKVPHNFFT
jgi:hypothetical protein